MRYLYIELDFEIETVVAYSPMDAKRRRLFARLWPWMLLLGFVACSAFLRIALPYGRVFTHGQVVFTTDDAYYFMRQVDVLVHNFPHFIVFDPYLDYPAGSAVGPFNLFVYFLGGVIRLIGSSSPAQHMVDTIGAWFPAVMGVGIIIPVYLIGKTLFNNWAGIAAAGLIAILPGEFLGRTMLGNTDRDALEALLFSITALFFILAIRVARDIQLAFWPHTGRHFSIPMKPALWSLASGVSLAFLLLTWRGGFLMVIIMSAYFVIQSVLDRLKYRSSDYLEFVGALTLLIALFIFWPISESRTYSAALLIPLLLILAFSTMIWLLNRYKAKPLYYPLIAIGIGVCSLVVLYVVSPSFFRWILGQLSVFSPSQTDLTVSQMQPIFFEQGRFSFAVVWANFGVSFFISLISLGFLVYIAAKRGDADKDFLLIWSVVTLVATLVMRRMALLFAINVALLTGYMSVIGYGAVQFFVGNLMDPNNERGKFRPLQFALAEQSEEHSPKVSPETNYYEILGIQRSATTKQIRQAYQRLVTTGRLGTGRLQRDDDRFRQITRAYSVLGDARKRTAYDRSSTRQQAKKTRASKIPRKWATRYVGLSVAMLVVFLLVFYPNLGWEGVTVTQAFSNAPSSAWQDSLSWLRNNSPQPLGSASSYYDSYQSSFHYPDTAYTVAAWWDYGYWISRIAHRLPAADPGGGNRELVAKLFTAQDADTASSLTAELASKYLVIDQETVGGKLYSLATYAGSGSTNYFETYYVNVFGKLVPETYYYPDYYKLLAVRLFYFDGNTITSDNTTVISYKNEQDQNGATHKVITDARNFPTFEEAEKYVSQQPTNNYRIVSGDPHTSPMPLPKLEYYKLVHTSTVPGAFGAQTPSVKIFEYVK